MILRIKCWLLGHTSDGNALAVWSKGATISHSHLCKRCAHIYTIKDTI